jgi:hypothetical protein
MSYQNFIIEESYKSSYIISVLISMFYNTSYIQDILNSDKKVIYNNCGLYLQLFLSDIVFKNIRTNKTITNNQINKLRNFLFKLKFKQIHELLDEHRPIEFYKFMINLLECDYIYYVSDNKYKQIQYIEFQIDSNTNIKTKLADWENGNLVKKVPNYFTICINRTNKQIECDINEYVKFNNSEIYKIHSMVCYSEYYNYYSVLLIDNKWYSLTHAKIKTLIQINIKNKLNIKKEVQMLFYCKVN